MARLVVCLVVGLGLAGCTLLGSTSVTPGEVRDRLDQRFRLLVGTRRALERHHTLRHAVSWSYDLLSGTEQSMLQRCAVFAGGFDLDSACAVAGSDDLDEYAHADRQYDQHHHPDQVTFDPIMRKFHSVSPLGVRGVRREGGYDAVRGVRAPLRGHGVRCWRLVFVRHRRECTADDLQGSAIGRSVTAHTGWGWRGTAFHYKKVEKPTGVRQNQQYAPECACIRVAGRIRSAGIIREGLAAK